jgi:transposase
MRKTSAETRSLVLERLCQGESARKVAASVDISPRTVNRIRNDTISRAEKPSAGRQSILTERQRRQLARWVTSGSADTAVDLQAELRATSGTAVSVQTVRNALKSLGMKAYVKKKKPLLTPRHRKQRLDFAIKYQHWTREDWHRVVFSDETKINRLGSDGVKWVWKNPQAQLTHHHVTGTAKFGGGSLMLWGCMAAHGVGHCCRIDGRMDATLYVEILQGEFLGTLTHFGLGRGDIVFQQDNDPKHTSRIAQKWFRANNIQLLDWPAQSPDLNPIEHLWHYLKRQIASGGEPPRSIHDLWLKVESEWEKIPSHVCANLIDSMPDRIQAVLKAKGGHTNY